VQVSVAMEITDREIDVEAYAQAGVDQIVIVGPEINGADDIEPALDLIATQVGERAHTL
jgi:hypothetical protein